MDALVNVVRDTPGLSAEWAVRQCRAKVARELRHAPIVERYLRPAPETNADVCPHCQSTRVNVCPICDKSYDEPTALKASGCPTHGMEHFFEGMCIKCGVVPSVSEDAV